MPRPAIRHAFRLALPCALALCGGAARAQDESVFDRLFGSQPASERAGQASDGLALPSLFGDGKRIADAIPLHDLGPGQGSCVAIVALLDALELAHAPGPGDGGRLVTLPEPRREVTLPQEALLPSPSGDCLPLADLPLHLPLALTHDPVAQRLLLEPRAPLPVLMRLAREERQARLRPETLRPAFPLLARPAATARLWSAELAADLAAGPEGRRAAGSLLAAGELMGLAARLNLGLTAQGRLIPGAALSEARDTPDLLGPLAARSLALGDVAAPGQPLIADSLAGRGLLVSSRAPWRADLVDELVLSGPLPAGWEAELWHEERLVAVARAADAAGNWQFAGLQVRIGENRWVVRLYGPHGERSEQVFTRLVGTEMNAENEVGYTFGLVDGGRPLIGEAIESAPGGAAAFATLDWGVTSAVTARMDVRAEVGSSPALALGLNGAAAGSLWSVTAARDRLGGSGGALRLARRIGAQDIVFDLARHGRDTAPGLPAPVREYASLAGLAGQGRIGLGRLSLPWQLSVRHGALRSGRSQSVAAARLVLPKSAWQASLALGATRAGERPWEGTAALGITARAGEWRLRSGLAASARRGWHVDAASLSAARKLGGGNLALDLDWQADSGRLGGSLVFSRQFGNLGLSSAAGREGAGWRAGIGLSLGLWSGRRGWRTAPAGVTRSGAILAEMFVDEDADGERDAAETGAEGGRLIVGAALRGETADAAGELLIRGLPTGPQVDLEVQLASLEDFSLRPRRPGDRLTLRPGEVRHVALPLSPTGSLEAQVLLAAGDRLTPRAGVPVILRDAKGQEAARAVTDFDGWVLFDALPFGEWKVEAGGQTSAPLGLSREAPQARTQILIPPRA